MLNVMAPQLKLSWVFSTNKEKEKMWQLILYPVAQFHKPIYERNLQVDYPVQHNQESSKYCGYCSLWTLEYF